MDRADAARLGSSIESGGYDELWVNDTPNGDGLATLAHIAAATKTIALGVGVIALSGHTPAVIAGRVARAAISPRRLTLGVGSGSSRSVDLVRSGVAELRALLPDQQVAIAAVGPRMARLAGEIADTVVANWALPERLAELRELVAAGAAAAGRPSPRLVAYVRTAVGPGSTDRLRAEMDRYTRVGAHYARAFAEQGDRLIGVAVEPADPTAVSEALAPYLSVVDTVVVRGLPAEDTVEAWLEVATAASSAGATRPGLSPSSG